MGNKWYSQRHTSNQLRPEWHCIIRHTTSYSHFQIIVIISLLYLVGFENNATVAAATPAETTIWSASSSTTSSTPIKNRSIEHIYLRDITKASTNSSADASGE